MRDLIIGIDLGTTNSVVAVADDSGTPRVLADAQGNHIQPTVVSFHPSGAVVVGANAKQRRVIDPRNTIYSAKRLIGRTYGSREVVTAAERVPYTIKQGINHQPVVVTRAGEFAIPELAAIVLDHLRGLAQAALETEVTRAVVAVPANFTDAQRAATVMAGNIAGLEVVQVINEPTAAAIAYGHRRKFNKKVAIYDFGGGTFDVTIIEVKDTVYQVLATAGDPFLGGDDIDERLVETMLQMFRQQQRIDLRGDELAMQRLRTVAEQVKIELSRRPRALIKIDEIAKGPRGAPIDFSMRISREELEAHAAELVDRSFVVCREAMRMAGLDAEDIGDVVLVGGTTKMPLVRQKVAEFFGRPPRTDLHPDEAVAMGAAIHGHALRRSMGSFPRRGTLQNIVVPPAPPMEARAPRGKPKPQQDDFGRVITRPWVDFGGTMDADLEDGQDTLDVPTVDREPLTLDLEQARTEVRGQAPGTAAAGPGRRPAQTHTDFDPPMLPPPGQGTQESGLIPLELDLTDVGTDVGTDVRTDIRTNVQRERATGPDAQTMIGLELQTDLETPDLPSLEQDTGHAPAQPGLGELLPLEGDQVAGQVVGRAGQQPPARPGARPNPQPGARPGARPDMGPDIAIPPLGAPIMPPDPGSTMLGQPASRQPGRLPAGQTLPGAGARPGRDEDLLPLPSVANVAQPPGMPAARGSAPAGPAPLPVPLGPGSAPIILDVTPHTLGVATVAGYCREVVQRNSRVPLEIQQVFTTSKDLQQTVRIRVCQGESRRIDENMVLGDLVLDGIEPRPRGQTRIEVTFRIDESGILHVRARDQHTGLEQHAELEIPGLLSPAEIVAAGQRLRRMRTTS